MSTNSKIIPMENRSIIDDDMLFARLCDTPEQVARRNARLTYDRRVACFNNFLTKAILVASGSLATLIALLMMI